MPNAEPTLTNELPTETSGQAGGQTLAKTSEKPVRKTPRRDSWKATWKRTLARWRGEPPEIDLDYFGDLTQRITAQGAQLAAESDDDLRARAVQLRSRAKSGADGEALLVELFALVREAADRTIGQRPYDVQMLAGIALGCGHLVEMQTGEGKTLAAVAPASLRALSGEGVHILTFNDYLARRDALWMGPIYELLGFTVGFVQEGMAREERRQAYG